MLFTLYDALRQIDPHMVLDDGITARTVEQILFSVETGGSSEYVIGLDSLRRLVIFEVDSRGFAIFPAAFVESKASAASATSGYLRTERTINFLPRIARNFRL